jgi:primase-polymerase (primpol)-like protein
VRAAGKRPITPAGKAASSTDPRTWSTYREAASSTAGNGLGIMLGGGLGCYDLDHVDDAQARAFAATIAEPVLYAERSMSGTGVHVFVEAAEAPGWRRVVDGLSVERYTRERFIRTTGRVFALPATTPPGGRD